MWIRGVPLYIQFKLVDILLLRKEQLHQPAMAVGISSTSSYTDVQTASWGDWGLPLRSTTAIGSCHSVFCCWRVDGAGFPASLVTGRVVVNTARLGGMKHKNRMHHGLKNKSERFCEKFRSLCKPINFLDQQRSPNTLIIGCFFSNSTSSLCWTTQNFHVMLISRISRGKCSLETCEMSSSFYLLPPKQKLSTFAHAFDNC